MTLVPGRVVVNMPPKRKNDSESDISVKSIKQSSQTSSSLTFDYAPVTKTQTLKIDTVAVVQPPVELKIVNNYPKIFKQTSVAKRD